MNIIKTQIQKIHIAKTELKMSEDEYRSVLSSFGVETSKDLSYQDADKLLEKFQQLGWKPKPKNPVKGKDKSTWGKNNFSNLSKRPGKFATPEQLRMIEAYWKEVTGNDSRKSLNKFLKRITGIDNIEWLTRDKIRKIKKALEVINENNKNKKELSNAQQI